MKILFMLLLLTVSPFKDSKIAGDLYLYEYYRIDVELTESKEMLKRESFKPHLPEFTKTLRKIYDLKVKTNDMKFHQKEVRVEGEKAKEVSIIFLTQMVGKINEILSSLENIHGVMNAAESLATMISDQVEPVDFDMQKVKVAFELKKQKLETFLQLEKLFLSKLNTKFEDLIELKAKLALILKQEELYTAFTEYFLEINKEKHNLAESEEKLKDVLERKTNLKIQINIIEYDLGLFTDQIEMLNFEILDFYKDFFDFVLRFFDKPFEILTGKDWKAYSSSREEELHWRNIKWRTYNKSSKSLLKTLKIVKEYDVVLDESVVLNLFTINKLAKLMLRKMTTKSIFRFRRCNQLDLEDLMSNIIFKIDKLPVQKHKYDWYVIIIFNFFRQNIQSFCKTIYHITHGLANSLTSDLNLAMSQKFGEIIEKEEEEIENIWASLLKEGRNEEFLDFWKLKKKIEERASLILIVENEKKFEPTILNIFTYVVFIASIAAGLFAVRQREKEREEAEKLKRNESYVSFS